MSVIPRTCEACVSSAAGIAHLNLSFYYKTLNKKAKKQIEEWRENWIYPFSWEPKNDIERIERDFFDITAYMLSSQSPKFFWESIESKQLTFSLIKETVTRDPKVMVPILQSLWKLPDQELEKFARLVEHYWMSNIITISSLVRDRMEFIKELKSLIHTPESKKVLLERKHIHKILEKELRIFWDWYEWGTSDETLEAVLKSHISALGRTDLITDTEMESEDRPDLFLYRQYPQSSWERFEHLITHITLRSNIIHTFKVL
jgi:hypothetical protein